MDANPPSVEALRGRRVVYLNNFAEPFLGGGEVHLTHLLRGAIAAGLEPTLVASPGSGIASAGIEAGAEVVEMPFSGLPTALASRIGAVAREAEAAVVHGTGYYTNILARLAGRRAGAAVVNQVHCEPDALRTYRGGARGAIATGARRSVDAATERWVDAWVADSEALRDAVLALGVSAAKVTVAHNGVDPAALRAEAARGELPGGVPFGERPLVGTVGRLEAVKGLPHFLDAAVLVAARMPDALFLVAGSGPDRDALEARVKADPALHGRVRLLGFVPSAHALMARLDVYCLPSLSEGFNTTILEALALGVPAVVTSVGGAPEVVEDGVTGRLVPPADPRALADALLALLEDRAAAGRMAAAGRARVEERFTVERMVERILGVYAGLLA